MGNFEKRPKPQESNTLRSEVKALFRVITYLSCFAGCMICLGKSNYFRFNHPREAKRIKESNPGNRFSIVPDQYYPGMHDFYMEIDCRRLLRETEVGKLVVHEKLQKVNMLVLLHEKPPKMMNCLVKSQVGSSCFYNH